MKRVFDKARPAAMKTRLLEKLHPARFSEMSPLMGAIVGYVLGEAFTKLTIAELVVNEAEGVVYIRQEGKIGFEGIQSLDDLRNNWNRLMDAADLTADERTEAVRLFNARVCSVPGTEI
jgi:hypothetical protein